MEKPNGVCHKPACLLAHDLVNKLAVIVGQCALLSKHMPEGSEGAKRLGLIHDAAKDMAKELNDHQCHLAEAARGAIASETSLRVCASAD